jgi:hypothetical protein
MPNTIINIWNNNTKNEISDDIYKSFNSFIFSEDTKLIGKLLHRYKYFSQVMHLPGDIVEMGVFKGSGIASFCKFLDIFCPNSNKKVIGFDIFNNNNDTILSKDGVVDKELMNIVYSRVNTSDLSLESVTKRLDGMKLDKKYMLVEGDIQDSLPVFLKENPGFRVSMIYIDVDLGRATYNSLKYLWSRLLPGGMVIFDEYEYHKFTESDGVEQFLKEFNLSYELISTNWIAPTCYMIKKNF